jgi:hypothetical protein
LEAYLARLYVIDKNNFENLADKIKGIKEAEQKLQDIDNSLKEACRKYGISESELAQIYERGGSEAEIQTLVYKRLNILQKVWDKLTGGNLAGERIKELKQIENIKSKIDEIHNYLIEVSQMIATAVFETQEGRTFLTKALYGQIEKLGGGISFKEAVYSEEDLEREWEEYIGKVTKEGGTFYGKDRNDPVVKQELRNGFMSYLIRKRFGNKRVVLLMF